MGAGLGDDSGGEGGEPAATHWGTDERREFIVSDGARVREERASMVSSTSTSAETPPRRHSKSSRSSSERSSSSGAATEERDGPEGVVVYSRRRSPKRPSRFQTIPEEEADEAAINQERERAAQKRAAQKSSSSKSLRPASLRGRGQSPRRKVDEDELQDVLAEIIHDQSLTLTRAARAPRPPRDGDDAGREGGRNSSARSSAANAEEDGGLVKMPAGRRAKPRRQRRKADDAVPEYSPATERRFSRGFHPLQGLQQFVSRATARTESTSAQNTWMQMFGDIIMWRDVPRSTLLFGAGCFCILSASFIQDVRCGALTFTAYMALVYLGAVFLHRNFLRGGSSQCQDLKNWELGEFEALEMLRVVLPALNTMLRKCGQLFCGDPSTTLKVASILWILAQAGYFMTIWSFARIAFVLMFIIPKLYLCYAHQLHGQAEAYADRLWKAWTAYSHKKAAIFVALVLSWNLSSTATRAYGAFLLLVTIKLYTRNRADQTTDQMGIDQTLQSSQQLDQRVANLD